MNDNEEMEEKADDGEQVAGGAAPGDMKHLDFITSIVLMALSVYVVVTAHGYYLKSRKEFYASPGFLPTIIAGAIFLLALNLMVQSLNKSSVKDIFSRLFEAVPRGFKSARFKNTVAGLAIFAVYIYVMLRFLPFWLASAILLFACFIYLKAAKPVKSAIIALSSAVGIVLLFQVVFRVPMP